MITVFPQIAAERLRQKPFALLSAGVDAIANLQDGRCGFCGKPVAEVRDEAAETEFYIGGMCQTCQDNYFN